MSLGLLFGFFVTLTGFVVTFPASPTENNVVSYSKFQVWRITPSTNEENQILMKICETYGNSYIFLKLYQIFYTDHLKKV
jgi:hypothetical protein